MPIILYYYMILYMYIRNMASWTFSFSGNIQKWKFSSYPLTLHLERNRLLFREPLSFLFSDFIALWKKSIQRHPSGQHLERERFFSWFIRKTNTCHTADVGTPMMNSWEWWFKLSRVIPSFFQGSVNYHPSITHCGGMKLDAKNACNF